MNVIAMLRDDELSMTKRALIALGMAVAVSLVYWCIMDVWRGEWRIYSGRVTQHAYVPERYEPYTYKCGKSTCAGIRYHPPQHLVFASYNGDQFGRFNDPWAYSNLPDGSTCRLRARVGRSGWQWSISIEHVKP